MTETTTAPSGQHLGSLQLFIGGAWTDAVGGATRPQTSPSSGAEIARVPVAEREDARRAIAAARDAEETLRWMTPSQRSELCKRVAAALRGNQDELAMALALDQGKPLAAEARVEAGVCALFFEQAAEDILRLTGDTYHSNDASKRIISFHQSRGTYAVITPWNFPYNIASEYLSVALAAGNPTVWLPSPFTSACGAIYAKAFEEADLPAGAFNMVIGEGAVVGDEIVGNAGTVGVAFTGSPGTGRLIAQRAAGKPLFLELGGNGPVIVLADADLDAAADGVAFSAYLNAGQACSATERVLVERSVRDALVERVMERTAKVRLGDPLQDTTTMGPLNNEAVAEKMDRHVADAVEQGAVLLSGGRRAPDYPTELYYEPTVLVDVQPDMAVSREESFGPIVPVIDVDDRDAAISLANDNPVGLICSVYTKNLKAAFHAAEHLRTGIVNINETPDYWEIHVPYGGVAGKQSGIGRLGGMSALKEMVDVRTMIIDLDKGGF